MRLRARGAGGTDSCLLRELAAHFGKLLLHLASGAFGVVPIESDARGAFLQPKCAMERRQRGREPVRDRFALRCLHLFPRATLAIAVEMRMPLAHFPDQRLRDVAHIEGALLVGNDRMEEHLQQHVPQLFAHVVAIAATERVIELVRFFYEIGAKRLVRLRTVPVTARAKVAHERNRIVERRFVSHRSSGARKLFRLGLVRQCQCI